MNTMDDGRPEEETDAPRPATCGSVRDRLPLRNLGCLSAVENSEIREHLVTCAACREEADFVAALQRMAPRPPSDLTTRILAAQPAVPLSNRTFGSPWLRVAAILVLALGIGTYWTRDTSPDAIWSLALEPALGSAWVGEDWMVAGEPLLDALPDEVLRSLLEEMEP